MNYYIETLIPKKFLEKTSISVERNSWILSLLPTLKLKAVELTQILIKVRNLTKQNNFIIQKAEKGNTEVILDKESYIEKMKELLSGTSKFKRLDILLDKLSFVINYQDKIKNILKNFHDLKSLTDMLYKKTLPVGCHLGILRHKLRYTNLSLTTVHLLDQCLSLFTHHRIS